MLYVTFLQLPEEHMKSRSAAMLSVCPRPVCTSPTLSALLQEAQRHTVWEREKVHSKKQEIHNGNGRGDYWFGIHMN
jgi:hypothetical protein